ncbi:MAG: Fic family protein [Pseudomonadales bacterium]
MAGPQDQLADALEALKALQEAGRTAIRSRDLKRSHRERLVRGGFLSPVIKGWYVPARPDQAADGETTAWYASFWHFCAAYLEYRFGDQWCLSPDQSVLLHAGNQTVPTQLLVRSPRASNNITELLHGTSIMELASDIPSAGHLELVDGLRVIKLPQALIQSGPRLFTGYPVDARAALALVRDASEILPVLLEGGHSTVAGRLAGAFRNIGSTRIADGIVKSMRAAGFTIAETNPFEDQLAIAFHTRERSPGVHRIHAYWESMRDVIIQSFPQPPVIPNDNEAYLKRVDDLYVTDAYHSLSIEGYRVTPELIERVRRGNWSPDQLDTDLQHRDAMAARGYWLAFNEVRKSVEKVLNKENAGDVADHDHSDWYRALFGPSVEAGILKPADLAGYRNDQVYIRNSMHVPLKKEAILDCMPALFDHLREEEHPAVRTVLGHWIFVYIHPYMDGNGRMGRFLMNVMLASGGYPWTVVPVERRQEYLSALESASVSGSILPFAAFLGSLVRDQ